MLRVLVSAICLKCDKIVFQIQLCFRAAVRSFSCFVERPVIFLGIQFKTWKIF